MMEKQKSKAEEGYKSFIKENIPFYRWVRWTNIYNKSKRSNYYIRTCLNFGIKNKLIDVKDVTMAELNPQYAPTSVNGRKKVRLYKLKMRRNWVKCMLCDEMYKTTRSKGIFVCGECRKTHNWLDSVIHRSDYEIYILQNNKV